MNDGCKVHLLSLQRDVETTVVLKLVFIECVVSFLKSFGMLVAVVEVVETLEGRKSQKKRRNQGRHGVL